MSAQWFRAPSRRKGRTPQDRDRDPLGRCEAGVPVGPNHIRRHKVEPEGRLSGGEDFAKCGAGVLGGSRPGRAGRIWTSAADGVHRLNARRALIGEIPIPEAVAKVCFGGETLNRRFARETTSLDSVHLNVGGVSPV